MPAGRPSSYTPEIAATICGLVEETGSIGAASRQTGVARSTIERWTEEHEDFATAIARAKVVGYAARAELAVENAKTAEDAGLGRLAFDADRWYLSKIDPRRYGDKLDLTSAGERLPETPVEDTAARIAALLAKGLERQGETE